MSDLFWREGDKLPDELPGMFDENGKMMYGGWFEGQEPFAVEVDETPMQVADMTMHQLHDLVRKEVSSELAERTLPNWPVYFMNGQWLVTYEWVMREKRELEARIIHLEQRPIQTIRHSAINGLIAGLVMVLVLSMLSWVLP